MKYLIVVDMQVDFVSGALGTMEAQSIAERVVQKVRSFEGEVIFTRDTHLDNYLSTQEGKNLPVPHCIINTEGWQLIPELRPLCKRVIDKPAFGSTTLTEVLRREHEKTPVSSIELVGLCTDICVISNAMLIKAQLPEVPVQVVADCCAGVTPASHANALEAMKMCQIKVI